MPLYTLHDLTLEVTGDERTCREDSAECVRGLAFVATERLVGTPTLSLEIRQNGSRLDIPGAARQVFQVAEFSGLESGSDFYLIDGSSCFHLSPLQRRGRAHLAPSFFATPVRRQQAFWAFGLGKLLRSLGIYGLHAAGVMPAGGLGVLIVGPSGSGKSTLTRALIQEGWRYLCDDAVVLRRQADAIEALAFRENPSSRDSALDRQRVAGCVPRVMLFPRIVSRERSTLLPLDRLVALQSLLAQSGPLLFDRRTMPHHLELLKALLQQTAPYELMAGIDVYHHPGKLTRLLADAMGLVDGQNRHRADQPV